MKKKKKLEKELEKKFAFLGIRMAVESTRAVCRQKKITNWNKMKE